MTIDGAGIDPAVRERVIAQIDDFKEALDEAENHLSADTRDRLHKAGDELMRAVASVMLELGKPQPS